MWEGKNNRDEAYAAVAARQRGIPAVVGCGDATLCLKTGDGVRVDGGQGTMEMFETGDSTEA